MFSKNISDKSKDEVELVTFDVPFPPNYGGVIDVFFKIKAFNKAGIKVNLHCFEYGRKPSQELASLCKNVYYYQRNVSKTNLFRRRPYIVVTRSSQELLANLQKNNNPVLFEGLHCCYFLDDAVLQRRRKIVRTHNIEHEYYLNLAKIEKDIFKRYYFSNEAQKLLRFEKTLKNADGIAAISEHDKIYFTGRYNNVKVVSAFHSNEEVNISEGNGKYALYHGSLGIGENNEAALFLTEKVFNDLDISFIIAGNRPSKELRAAAEKYKNITLHTDVSTEDIYQLVRNAHINILPTFQSTGIKLKLLAALFSGRHCIVNSPMVMDTGLESFCMIKDDPKEIKQGVIDLFRKPFTSDDISKRKDFLNNSRYSNDFNIHQLIGMLFS